MYRPLICAIAAEGTVSLFEGAVKALDDLLERSVFFGDRVVIVLFSTLNDVPFFTLNGAVSA